MVIASLSDDITCNRSLIATSPSPSSSSSSSLSSSNPRFSFLSSSSLHSLQSPSPKQLRSHSFSNLLMAPSLSDTNSSTSPEDNLPLKITTFKKRDLLPHPHPNRHNFSNMTNVADDIFRRTRSVSQYSALGLISNVRHPTHPKKKSELQSNPSSFTPKKCANKYVFHLEYSKTLESCRSLKEFLLLDIENVCIDIPEENPPRSCISPYPHLSISNEESLLSPNIFSFKSSLHNAKSSKITQCLSLHPGAKFAGYQQSNHKDYDVVVDFKHISIEDSCISGYLNIKGLTQEHPSLTTYFDGEIIGSKYSFFTRKWDIHPDIDFQHWNLFPQFAEYQKRLLRDSELKFDPLSSKCLFMRWKEKFLVPDHNIQSINGASYDGFYYACLDLITGDLSGFYFHENTEWFEQLKLKYLPCQTHGIYEFH